MSSGQHLSKELYDLIKSIGETRSKQEEDKIIQTDLQVLKSKINDKNVTPKKMKEYLIRAIYIEMLGHDASFSYIHAVNLSRDKNLSIKRIGYLASSLFFGPDNELLILLVATLQADLNSKNVYEVMAALVTISKILCPFIVQAIVEPVSKLLNHTNENIRKKAVMALHKVVKIQASAVSEISDKINRALCDKDPSVMAASLNLFYELVRQNPGKYKNLTNSFVVILKQVIDHKLAREYDYHRIPAPWVQIKILQILSMLGANDQKTSEHIYEVLTQTLRRADDTGINIGFALTYQCVKTIATIYPNSQLLELASVSLSRFLSSEQHASNNNLKYLGINALISIVAINPKYALEHQMVVVDCLESRDETLKRETLDLLFRMTNPQNIETIAEKLLTHLRSASDAHFKKELVNKITQLAERYAPSHEWYINIMSTVLENGSEHVDSNILNNMLKLVEENLGLNPSFGEFLINTYLPQAQKDTIPDVLAKIISWVFGEVGTKVYRDQPDWVDGISENLLNILDKHFEDETTKGWILSSLSKLATVPGITLGDRIQEKFNKFTNSKYLDLQQRSLEYRFLSEYGSSSDLEYDSTLSFLAGFVEQAQRKGARPYDADKKTRGMMTGLALNANTTEGGELKVAYTAADASRAKNTNASGDATGIKVSQGKWTAEGYKDTKHESNINKLPQSLSAQYTKAISSQDIQKGKIFPGFAKETNSPNTVPSPGIGAGISSTQARFEDTARKEKEKEASALFAGLGGGKPAAPKTGTTAPTTTATTSTFPKTTTTTTSTTGGANPFGVSTFKPATTTTTTTAAAKPNPFGASTTSTIKSTPATTTTTTTQPAASNSANFDLLDLDFSSPAPVQQTQQTTASHSSNFDLLGGGFGGNTGFGGGFGSAPAQPSYAGKYQSAGIDLEAYEQYWNDLPSEVSENIQANVRNVSEFKTLLGKVNIGFVADIEGEVLGAGRRASGEYVLIYAKINQNGLLEVQSKSTNAGFAKELLQHLKEASKK